MHKNGFTGAMKMLGPTLGSEDLWSRRSLLALSLLLTLAFAFFQRSSTFGFLLYDDPFYVTGNAAVQGGLTWSGVKWAFSSLAGYYHPLAWLSLMVDAELFRQSAGGFHFTNVLLHMATAGLLFSFLQKLSRNDVVSLVTASLFAFHPLNIEAVAWISERKGLLGCFLGLAASHAYLSFAKSGSVKCLVFVTFLFLFAVLSKPSMVTLPLVFLLLDRWVLGRLCSFDDLRLRLSEKAIMFGTAAAVAVITIRAEEQTGDITPVANGAFHFLTPLLGYMFYLSKAVAPVGLHIEYSTLPSFLSVEGFTAMVAITWLLFWLRFPSEWKPLIKLGIGWFLVTLVPVSGIIKIGAHVAADRYFYFSGIGVFLAFAAGVTEVWRRSSSSSRNFRRALIAILCLLGGTYLLLASQRLRAWQNDHKLCEETLARDARNRIALNNYAWSMSMASTSVPPSRYDRSTALGLARSAARVTGFSDPNVLGTLAAGYAFAGHLSEARRVAEHAERMATHKKLFEYAAQLREQRLSYERRLGEAPNEITSKE